MLIVEELIKDYGSHRAVDQISFKVTPGEIVGIAGESGSGKSTLGRMLLNLLPHTSGKIFFEGVEWTHLPPAEKRSFRRKMQMVFQDPYSSLNPRFTIEQTLEEPLALHDMQETPAEWLEQVALPTSFLKHYPHELSGGQRQRVAIARALCTKPQLLVCDEALSALDKFTQYHILKLFEAIHSRYHPAILFISHDLGALEQLTERLLVMKKGQIIEEGATARLLKSPEHPYTQQLVAAHHFFAR